ncbi:unnamed protein product [Brassica oleracea var. botrytis]
MLGNPSTGPNHFTPSYPSSFPFELVINLTRVIVESFCAIDNPLIAVFILRE